MPHSRSTEFSHIGPFLVLAAIVLVLYFARDLLIPFAFALTLAFFLAPAVARLESRRIPRVFSVAIVGIVVSTMLCGAAYVVARQLMDVARNLPYYRLAIQHKVALIRLPAEQSLENAITAVEDISGDLATTTKKIPVPEPTIAEAAPVRIVDPRSSQLQATTELLMRFLRPIGICGVVIVFTIYLLMKREDLRHRILLLAGMGRISLMTQALQDAATRISQYLIFQAAVNAAYGALFGFGLFLLKVPNATLWGVLAGVLRIIPYVGTATGLVVPLLVSVAISTSWWQPFLILGLFLALELTATNFVEPWLFSSRTGISSLALLAMAIFWALLWGWPGLVLSTPLTVCIVVMGRYIPQLSFLHTLLGTDAELSAEAHFYERLLAMDQQEAHTIANRFLKGNSLVQLYDSVLIPALALVEQDRHQGLLDDARCNFFFLCISELVAELADYHEPEPAGDVPFLLPPSAKQQDFAVVCISANDQADELTSLMLGQLMERSSHQTLLLPAASVSAEILDTLAHEQNTVIFITALPPFAFSQARAICQRIRSHLPSNRIVIGLWNPGEDPEQPSEITIERFGAGKPNVIVNSLSQAVRQINSWAQSSTQPIIHR